MFLLTTAINAEAPSSNLPTLFQHYFQIAFVQEDHNIRNHFDGVEQNVALEHSSVHHLEADRISSAFREAIARFLPASSFHFEKQKSYRFECNAEWKHLTITVTDISERPDILPRITVVKAVFLEGDRRREWENHVAMESAADSVIALAVAIRPPADKFKVENWDADILRQIIAYGQGMYEASRTKKVAVVLLKDVKQKFRITKTLKFDYEQVKCVNDDCKFSVVKTKVQLESYFKENNHCIFLANGQYVAIIKENDKMYLFDTHGRGPSGLNQRERKIAFRQASLIICENIPDLAEVLVRNLGEVPFENRLSHFKDDVMSDAPFVIYSVEFTDSKVSWRDLLCCGKN